MSSVRSTPRETPIANPAPAPARPRPRTFAPWGAFVLAAIAWTIGHGPSNPARASDGGQRDLYLASRDEIRRVIKIVDEMPRDKGGTLVGIVGGLAVLNFAERLQPSQILLIDLNPAQVEYGRCIVELVKLSPNRAAFVSAFFSRPFKTDDDEETFLSQPGDRGLLRARTGKIEDPALRESCARDLGMIAAATWDDKTRSLLVPRNSNGRFLQLRGPDTGMPTGFNYLYYDRGWLASDASYTRTRNTLRSAEIRFLASDIGAVPVEQIRQLRGQQIVFWGTNLATWYREGREAYERFVVRLHEELFARNEAIHLVVASTYRRTLSTRFLPFEQLGGGVHLDAAAKVKKHTAGKTVLELIPGKASFGRELRAKDVVVQRASEPIDPAASFDVAVLHILNNSGLRWWQSDRSTEFTALYEQVLARAREVVILEHDRTSGDFSDKEKARMVGLGELLRPLFPVLAKRRLALTLEPAVGQTDTRRNFVLSIKRL